MVQLCERVRRSTPPFPITAVAGRSGCRPPSAVFLLASILVLCGCSSPNAAVRSHYRDYAFAIGSPYPQEAATAQERFNRYMAHLTPEGRQRLAGYEYVAVEVSTVPLSDVGGAVKSLVNSGQVFGDLANDRFNPSSARAPFVMVFSTKTMQPATNEGYITIDTPQRGKPGLFGGYDALYIGKGK